MLALVAASGIFANVESGARAERPRRRPQHEIGTERSSAHEIAVDWLGDRRQLEPRERRTGVPLRRAVIPRRRSCGEQCCPPVQRYRVCYTPVVEEHTKICSRPVYETCMKECSYTVMKPCYEQHIQECVTPVCRPVVECYTVPQTYCTQRPVYEQHTRQECYTTCRPVYEQYCVPQTYCTQHPCYEQHVPLCAVLHLSASRHLLPSSDPVLHVQAVLSAARAARVLHHLPPGVD